MNENTLGKPIKKVPLKSVLKSMPEQIDSLKEIPEIKED